MLFGDPHLPTTFEAGKADAEAVEKSFITGRITALPSKSKKSNKCLIFGDLVIELSKSGLETAKTEQLSDPRDTTQAQKFSTEQDMIGREDSGDIVDQKGKLDSHQTQ